VATWNSTYEDSPKGTDSPTQGDDAIRDVKSEVQQRVNQEHVFLDTASTGATVHRSGSARIYYQATEPALRPDGATSLDSSDTGRIWMDSDDDTIKGVWTGTAFAVPSINVTDLTSVDDITVGDDLNVGGDLTVTNDLFVAGKISTGGEDSPDCADGGICLNHGENDAFALTIKNSDVAHEVTDLAETDTYFTVDKFNDDTGGCRLTGFTDSTGIGAMILRGIAATANSSTSNAAAAAVSTYSYLKDGTGVTSFAADNNIFAVKNGADTMFLVKGDGDIYYDGADQGAYDDEDDFELIESANHWKDQSLMRNRLEELGVIVNGFISNRKMTWLQNGAICKLIRMLDNFNLRLRELEGWNLKEI
jgi:hypothetical protein